MYINDIIYYNLCLNIGMLDYLIEEVIKETQSAINRGDEPYGAIVADHKGNIVSRAGNEENTSKDPTRHAEVIAISRACRYLGRKDLKGYILVTNYKPCPMCAALILMVGIDSIYCGTDFDGFDLLFETVVKKIKDESFEYKQKGLKHDECRKQVMEGRGKLKKDNPYYTSGHLNGIL